MAANANDLSGESLRVIVVDDHSILREGLKLVLGRMEKVAVVGEAGDGFAAVRLSRELKPDLVILDIQMPRMNGLHAARRIRQEQPEVRILALSADDDVKTVRLLLACGVSGFVLKSGMLGELTNAIETVLSGKIFLAGKFAGINTKDLAVAEVSGEPLLDPKQREILELYRKGMSVEAIADQTLLSFRTVTRHLKRIENVTTGLLARPTPQDPTLQ